MQSKSSIGLGSIRCDFIDGIGDGHRQCRLRVDDSLYGGARRISQGTVNDTGLYLVHVRNAML